MAFSTKSVTTGIRNLHSTYSSSCRCQPDNQKPSSTSRLHLQLPPSRTPSTPLQHHRLHLNHQKPTPPFSESTLPASPPHRPATRKPAASTSDILRLFHTLDLPFQPDLYVSLVKECTLQRDSTSALRLHGALKQLSHLPLLLLNRMLLMHVSCGHFRIARQLFDEMPPLDRHAISWAILLTAYSHNAQYDETILLFLQMLQDDDNHHRLLQFPRVAMVSVLKACMYTQNKGLGKQLHGLLLKFSPTVTDDLAASLADFNFDNGINHLQCDSKSIWASKIELNCKEGRFAEVIEDFTQMTSAGICCRDGVLCNVMRACGKMEDGGRSARQVHAFAIKLEGGLNGKVVVQCGLIKMYGGCGLVQDAEQVFETMVVDKKRCGDAHWNAVLMCYLQNGLYVEAFKLLYKMKAAAVEVTESLVNKVRIACGTGTTLANSFQ
ncbi:Pentatricopeptide repeat-containing protein At1g31790 [Linum grandiflorum]